jgi:hypothetical protein
MTTRNRTTWRDVIGALAMTALLIAASGLMETL